MDVLDTERKLYCGVVPRPGRVCLQVVRIYVQIDHLRNVWRETHFKKKKTIVRGRNQR